LGAAGHRQPNKMALPCTTSVAEITNTPST